MSTNPYQPTPWQVKFTYAFGIPAVIALYLVYNQTERFEKNQAEFNRQIIQLATEVRNLNGIVSKDSYDKQIIEKKYDTLMNMMVRVCATTAENNTDRNACFEYAGTQGTVGNEEFGGIKPKLESMKPEKLKRY